MVASARDIATSLRSVNKDAQDLFMDVAQELIDDIGSQESLARAIAFISGVTEKLKTRSLLCSIEGYKTYLIKCKEEFSSLGFIWNLLRMKFENKIVDSIKGLKKLGGEIGAAFDIPEEHVKALEEEIKKSKDDKFARFSLEPATEMP